MNPWRIGHDAERRAASFLEGRGMEILAENYRIPGAEIDLIAQDGLYLVFVEVKARSSAFFGLPRETVTLAKQARICRAALRYMAEQNRMEAYVRFDVVEVMADRVSYFPNAFEAAAP